MHHPRVPLITCQKIRVAFGGKPLLDSVDFVIERGERVGLLGRNGEGKSTLMKVLSSELKPDAGTMVCTSGAVVTMLPQQVPMDITGSISEVISDSEHGGYVEEHAMERLCSLLRLEPDAQFESLSGGQKRRVLLAKALAAEPDLLLLDEPTNHLDLDGIQWLESFLSRFHGAIMFVTHDRTFLQKMATRILDLDRGKLTSWSTDYSTYLRDKEVALEGEEKQWAQFDKKLAQEEVWVRQGVKARRTRNEGRVRALERLRAERAQRREKIEMAEIQIVAAARSGRKVISAKNVTFAYGTADPTIRDLSITIMRGDRVGIIGPNGCGKTTLLNLLLQKEKPQSGLVEHGTNLEVAYFDQHRRQLDDSRSVKDNLADGRDEIEIDGRRRHVMGYLQDFLFEPSRARQPVKVLSGGERNRLLLAKLFTEPSNLLILDEPTNDLDTETLELLEARLLEYTGTVLLVSHDRAFLDNLCSSSLVFEGDGQVTEYVGGYSDWQAVLQRQASQKKKEEPVAPPANEPKRVPTKKLTNREREAWQSLPSHIEKLEAELAMIQTQLADPVFYKTGGPRVREATDRATVLQSEIETAYAQWDDLEARTK